MSVNNCILNSTNEYGIRNIWVGKFCHDDLKGYENISPIFQKHTWYLEKFDKWKMFTKLYNDSFDC